MDKLKANPKAVLWGERWWIPAEYLPGTFVCPFCHLPESTGEYKLECHCWDKAEGIHVA